LRREDELTLLWFRWPAPRFLGNLYFRKLLLLFPLSERWVIILLISFVVHGIIIIVIIPFILIVCFIYLILSTRELFILYF
jgi:hypothetical protein